MSLDVSQNPAGLVEPESRQLRKNLRRIAVAHVAKEVGFDPAVGEELGVDLGVVEARHSAHVEADGARGDHEVGPLERAVAERDRLGEADARLVRILHLGPVREEPGKKLVEARVVPDDRRDWRRLGLVEVARAERREQPRLRLRRADEEDPRRTGVRARRTGPHDVVDRPELVVADRDRQPAVLRPGVAEDQVEGLVVEGLAHVAPPARRPFVFAPWMACHTRSAVAGMSSCRTPTGASASMTAFMTAGSAPTVPASPAPLAPSGLSFVGTGLLSMCMSGNVSPRGSAYSMNDAVRS